MTGLEIGLFYHNLMKFAPEVFGKVIHKKKKERRRKNIIKIYLATSRKQLASYSQR